MDAQTAGAYGTRLDTPFFSSLGMGTPAGASSSRIRVLSKARAAAPPIRREVRCTHKKQHLEEEAGAGASPSTGKRRGRRSGPRASRRRP